MVASLDGGISVCVEYAGGESGSCNILSVGMNNKIDGRRATCVHPALISSARDTCFFVKVMSQRDHERYSFE